jgi:hypothetical protein
MSSYILYNNIHKNDKKQSDYLIKQIDNLVFKRMLTSEIHKKFNFQIQFSKLSTYITKNHKIKGKENPDEMVNVIFMPEINNRQLKIYLNTFNDEPDNLKKYAEYLAVISYNLVNPNRFQVKKYFQKLLEEQSSYWEDDYNCNITLNDIFIKRKFNYDSYSKREYKKSGTLKIESQIKSLTESNFNYLNELDRYQDKEALFKPGNNYWIGKQSSFTNNDVTEIYTQIPTEYLKYNFLCNMICSRTHCHLILNNMELLKLATPLFEKYKVIFKYLIGYGWLTLRQEEVSTRNKLKDNDRVIFDIDTVNNLPMFPFGLDEINQNPYASVLLDNELMNLKENCMSMDMIKNNSSKYYGLPDKETFQKRLNIFVNGKNEPGILAKLNWSKLAITGSAITACGMKFNPLFDICKVSNEPNITDADFQTFLFHYYNNSDIDMVCTETTMTGYLDTVDKIIKELEIETNSTLNCTNVHTGSIVFSDELINQEIDELKIHLKNQSINVGWIKANFDNLDVKKYFYNKFYIPWKNELIAKYLVEKPESINTYVYAEYLTLKSVEEFKLYTLDYEVDADTHKKTDYEKYIYNSFDKLIGKLVESIRFQIKSEKMIRSWEIFKSHNENIFSTVGRFHMGFVRACWNGKTLLCLPSFISSMMVQMSTDYKYFASIRNPIEIINKYRSRGFGIILNDTERIHMAYYNGIKKKDEENKWYDMYNININNKTSINSIFGTKKVNDNIFKPSKYFEGMPDDCFKYVEHQYFTTSQEAFASMYPNNLSDLYKYTCINLKGQVAPLNRDIIKIGYEIINKI